VRHDFTHVRVGYRGPAGVVICAPGGQTREVLGELGPPIDDRGGVQVWGQGGDDAVAVVAGAVDGLASAGWWCCVNDRWVVLEHKGNLTDAPTLAWALERAAELADALEGSA
jgi:hypothetical protein